MVDKGTHRVENEDCLPTQQNPHKRDLKKSQPAATYKPIVAM